MIVNQQSDDASLMIKVTDGHPSIDCSCPSQGLLPISASCHVLRLWSVHLYINNIDLLDLINSAHFSDCLHDMICFYHPK